VHASSAIPPFSAATTFEGRAAIISLRGGVDDLAAFELATIINAAMVRQPASLTLDLAEVVFIGDAGLVVISDAENRLVGAGMALTIRSPSVLVTRHLGGAQKPPLGHAAPGNGHLGPEQLGVVDVVSQRFGSSLSAPDLRRVAGMPTDPDVVDGALDLVVELALASIGDADGVSVSLRRHGVLSTVAASDQTIREMDANQYATSEGPCVEASVKGHWFHAESLDTETRWPAFTPRARALGIKAILSSPLRAFDQPVGALNIYSRTASTFEVKDQQAAATFADKASVILSDAHIDVSDRQMALRFQEALRSREVLSLAKGIIMERSGTDEEGAFNALLRLSLQQGTTLRARAEAILGSVGGTERGPEGGTA
jgi:anti-anti-sigma regulatory factor/GAF domain-containing protein